MDKLDAPKAPSRSNKSVWQPWLSAQSQTAATFLLVVSSISIAVYFVWSGGLRGRLIEIDHAPPIPVDTRIDLNQADWPELCLLPGISETYARRIVEFRETHGPYASVDELMQVKGIGPKRVEMLRPLLKPIADVHWSTESVPDRLSHR